MFIYALKDPETGEIRYIGKTNNPKKRMSSHLSPEKSKSLPSIRWVLKLRKQNKKPIMEIIEETDDWESCEIKWISYYRSIGCDLLNIDNGGIVKIYQHCKYDRKSSKKYLRVMSMLSNLPEINEEASGFWKLIKNGIKQVRSSIRIDLGEDAVSYFDNCIYAEFIERKPMSFRVLQ
jgi:hypothetical protein